MKKAIATAPNEATIHKDMSPQQVEERQAEEAAYLAAKPMEDWKDEIAELDHKMPRYMEDVIEVLSVEQKAALASHTKAAYTEKKNKRSEKPQGE